jgi:hypothetical protein
LLFLSADGRASENDWCSLPPSCFCLKGHCFPCLFSHCYPLAFAHGQSVGPNLVAHFKSLGWALLAYACNPSYLGGWDWENRGSRPAWANSPWDPISKITREKWTGGVAHVVGCLLLNHKVMHSNPSPTKKKKKKKKKSMGHPCQCWYPVLLWEAVMFWNIPGSWRWHCEAVLRSTTVMFNECF